MGQQLPLRHSLDLTPADLHRWQFVTSIHPNFNQIAEHQYVGGPDRLIVSRKDKDKDKDKNKDKDIFQKCRYIDNRYFISIF